MAILKAKPRGKLTIDLAGPQGNAFFLLATARRLGEQLELTETAIQGILRTMKGGNYKNLVETFDANFGNVVDLILPENGL